MSRLENENIQILFRDWHKIELLQIVILSKELFTFSETLETIMNKFWLNSMDVNCYHYMFSFKVNSIVNMATALTKSFSQENFWFLHAADPRLFHEQSTRLKFD